jgi:hypothetical protein
LKCSSHNYFSTGKYSNRLAAVYLLPATCTK